MAFTATGSAATNFIEVLAVVIRVEGYDESLVFLKDSEVVPKHVFFVLPEYCTHTTNIHFRVKKRPIKNLHYHQCVKRAGFTVRSRKILIGEHIDPNRESVPDEEEDFHISKFEPETLPGGFFVRGTYPAVSQFLEENEIMLEFFWNVGIVKKHIKPSIRFE